MASETDSDEARMARLQRRRELRRESTNAESLLWHLLRGRQFGGAKFRRQHQVGRYVLDFYCPERRLAIEADGSQHLSEEGMAKDEERRRFLELQGIRVIRFSEREILLETEEVSEAIWQALLGNLDRGAGEEPSP